MVPLNSKLHPIQIYTRLLALEYPIGSLDIMAILKGLAGSHLRRLLSSSWNGVAVGEMTPEAARKFL
jgi:hypothetical protein